MVLTHPHPPLYSTQMPHSQCSLNLLDRNEVAYPHWTRYLEYPFFIPLQCWLVACVTSYPLNINSSGSTSPPPIKVVFCLLFIRHPNTFFTAFITNCEWFLPLSLLCFTESVSKQRKASFIEARAFSVLFSVSSSEYRSISGPGGFSINIWWLSKQASFSMKISFHLCSNEKKRGEFPLSFSWMYFEFLSL